MEDGRIPKDILFGDLASGKRAIGRPRLRYKDVCKRDMKALDIDIESWEDIAANRARWRSTVNSHLTAGEAKLRVEAEVKRTRRKESASSERVPTVHICDLCNRDCHSHIGLYSHRRRCANRNNSQDATPMVNIDHVD